MSTQTERAVNSDQKREHVLERDDYRCRLCARLGKEKGGPANLEAHHSPPNRCAGSTTPQYRTTLCRRCHRHHHALPSPSDVDFESMALDPAPGDLKIVDAINRIGKSRVRELAIEAGLSDVYTYQRLYALTAGGVVAPLEGGQWDIAKKVDKSIIGTLPDSPKEATRLARDEMMRRMERYGLNHEEIAEITGLTSRTVKTAIDRARALRPPVPPIEDTPAVESKRKD